ncbi:MAG TPA: hypothetical protein VKB88_23825 [Bryobacteraceae bacterium]|nr:hypothetical protein [Bryobacteraceae bacterium]
MQTNTKNSSPTSATPAQAQSGAPCQPCDIPPFCRSYFYTGKLLTEGDLNLEQRYASDKLRLHYVGLHGWGVVCGLMVRPHPQCPDRFVVEPGFAVDDCGREIRLVKECVTFFPKPPAPPPEPCPPEYDRDDEEEGEEEERERRRKNRCRTYYICIRYDECKEDFMPVVFDDCCSSSPKPNRVCECAVVELSETPPACLEEIEKRHYHHEHENCHEIWEHLPKDCPPTDRVCCIPLAVIRDYEYRDLTAEMIDNSIRPVMPTAQRLEHLIHCVMDKLPKAPPRLSHITHINWEHDAEYRPQDFLRDFVGAHESPRGFEIEFDGRVHHKGLNNRTFQAMIVRDSPEGHEARHLEIAPARVHRSEDGYHCTLHIDPDYARHHLHESNFDVYITLHCDKVLDERGIPVDGDLLATLAEDQDDKDRDYILKYPTGDGVPGGLFESWIRVRRGR